MNFGDDYILSPLSILLWGCLAYSFQQHIVNALLKPAHGQHFIYTSPGGGIDFLFPNLCLQRRNPQLAGYCL